MSLKYKIAAAIVSLPLFFTVFFAPCLLIRASTDGVNNNWWERLLFAQYSNFTDLPEDFKNLGEAYVNTFKSIGSSDFFDSVADIPMSWYHILDDTTPVLSVGGAVFYYLDSNGNLKYTKKGSSGSSNSIENNATIVDSRDKLAIDGSVLKRYVDDNKDNYAPTGRVNKISFKSDPIFANSNFDYFRYNGLTFLYDGNFFKVSGLDEVYCALFYFDGNNYYYSQYGFHFYLDNWADSSGEFGTSLFYDSYNFFELADVINDIQVFEDISAYRYLKFYNFVSTDGTYGNINNTYSINGFSNLDTYLKNRASGSKPDIWYNAEFSRFFVSSLDCYSLSEYLLVKNFKTFTYMSSYSVGYDLSVNAVPCDWGFVYSDTKFTMDGFVADIDPTKIPDNYYITVGGDTIYDYNITNPVTGDTTTINNYITNNYTFITNQGDGTGGGTVNNYYDGAIINNGDNHYYDGATINNGDNITNNYNFSDGDTNFFTEIGVAIENSLQFVFVPSDGYMNKFNADLRNTLESKIPFVYDIGDIFNSLFVDIVDNNLVYVSDINSDGSVDESSVIYPKWTFNVNFFGTDYELIYLDFSMYSSTFFYIRTVVACFTYLAFFVMLLKSLPSIIGNVGSLVSASYSVAPYVIERFSDVPKGGD